MTVTDFNFYHIFNFILLLLALFGVFYITKDIINSFNHKQGLKLIEKLSMKDVKIITIENTREIHEINKKLDALEDRIKNAH